MTLTEINSIAGEGGDFEVRATRHPRYVSLDKCIACGVCAEKCPKKVPNEYDAELGNRKAIYVKYPQAVPLKYAIDEKNCIYFIKGKCRACEKLCPAGAVNFEDKATDVTLHVGAVVIAPGSEAYDVASNDVYGYARSGNIVTSLEFERILSSTGPFEGHLVRPSDHKEPGKIAWIQCVGSRDMHAGSHGYCSSVCCTYAIKEAIIAKEHSNGDLDAAIFYIDMRTHGKDFEKYYNRARNELGVRFIRSRITSIPESPDTGDLVIQYVDERGRKREECFDMAVLSVGLSAPGQASGLGDRFGIKLDRYGFPVTRSFRPVETSKPGIFVCGAFQGPKDIPQSVIESSACAAAVGSLLGESRGSLARTKEAPVQKDVIGERPQIGVFVCKCGTNIAGVIDTSKLAENARALPDVVYVEENLFSCSQDTQEKITQIIKEKKLNRVVVAACTPRTHEELFQETVVNAGINKYLFEMANIRNQCSWVHRGSPELALEKAIDQVRMAVGKVRLAEPISEFEIGINQSALIVGGGISGLAAARNLSEQGYHVHLIEKSTMLGGQARNIYRSWVMEDVREELSRLIEDVQSSRNVDVYLDAELKNVDGFVGNFRSTIAAGRTEKVLDHGVAIIATGASELKPDGYLYGEDDRVITGLELDAKLMNDDHDSFVKGIQRVVFVQCVGSRIEARPYCSKVCCTHSIRNAVTLKKMNPAMDIFIIYRDIRSYGLREDLYREARSMGVVFVQYEFEKGLQVERSDKSLRVRFMDSVLHHEIEISPELLVLASAIVPPEDNAVARMFKVPLNEDGFFVEAHVKLRPIDFSTEGVFVCGLAHSPKPIDESIAHGLGAASRAVTLLSKERMLGNALVAEINQETCAGCQGCMGVCSFEAISFLPDLRVCQINEALCKGCGACAATCTSGSIKLRGFTSKQIFKQIEAVVF
jgi:heterodisulfide reductase subunit A